MNILNQLVMLQQRYDLLQDNNKILKEELHKYELRKIKNKFEEEKRIYIEIVDQLEGIKKQLLDINSKIVEERKSIQENEVKFAENNVWDRKFVEDLNGAIESAKAKIIHLEEDSLTLMEKEEKLQIDMDRLKNEVIKIKKDFYTKKEEVNMIIDLAKEKIQQAEYDIKKLRKEIPEEILSAFDKLIKLKGSAVTLVEGNTCLGCNIKLPSIIIDNIKKNEELVFCNNCGRILYTAVKR